MNTAKIIYINIVGFVIHFIIISSTSLIFIIKLILIAIIYPILSISIIYLILYLRNNKRMQDDEMNEVHNEIILKERTMNYLERKKKQQGMLSVSDNDDTGKLSISQDEGKLSIN